MQEERIQSLGQEDPLEQEMTTLQYSCLENPMDRGVWRELQSWTWLSDWAYIINSLSSSDLWQAGPYWIHQCFVYHTTFEPEGYTWGNISYLLGESHKTFRRSPIPLWCPRNLRRFSPAPQFLDPPLMLLLIPTSAVLWEVEQLPHETCSIPGTDQEAGANLPSDSQH